ncbi:MAG: T9SS type A sorting domain-containing protein [Saprospiraceae bacterium]|nr:T9SS type A sorting domain-containing protein [Saprospiraceae bacterium]
MANNTGGVFNDYYIPQNNNWKKVIINSFSNVATKQPSLKLRFLFKVDSKQVDANNFYIDEININDENLNSINEIESPIIKIYPNPTFNGEIKIEINSNDKIRYFANLYNTDGKLIESFDSLTHNDHISSFKINDRNHLLTGVYYIKIFTENGTLSTEKIIICN